LGWPYWATADAGAVDFLQIIHNVCDTRECAAKTALENGIQGEMGGGTYTYETLPGMLISLFAWGFLLALSVLADVVVYADQVAAGTVDVKYIDQTVKAMLTTKFALGLFEST
jgi:beta-glucosidase